MSSSLSHLIGGRQGGNGCFRLLTFLPVPGSRKGRDAGPGRQEGILFNKGCYYQSFRAIDMGEDTIFSIGEWTVTPGKEKVFLEKWRDFSQWSLNHINGGRWVYVVQDRERPNKFISFGIWESAEDYAAWRHSTKFKSAFAEFGNLCDKVEYSTSPEVLHRYR